MNDRFYMTTRFALAMLVCTGCGTANPPAIGTATANPAATPESAYRQLMMAMLTGDETKVRELIVDPDGADALSEGGYPKEVAVLLAEQYQTMNISRNEAGDTDRFELNSSAFPLPLTVIKVGGSWKVGAGPIIKARRAAESFRPSPR